jgi:hypothetical protein
MRGHGVVSWLGRLYGVCCTYPASMVLSLYICVCVCGAYVVEPVLCGHV